MNSETRRYFDEIYRNRMNIAEVLDCFATRNIWTSVVDKYSDQAHFIYELLQNADDVGATSVAFELESDKLVFRHNGTRHFTVTSASRGQEDIDKENGTLGDVNSITAIYNSNKYNKAAIGKFGAGFKAVFQYTSTPHIYDPQFSFKIINFFVPVLLNEDFLGREEDETIFVFPFDLPEKPPRVAYEDILIKLKSLVYPQLFLQNIKFVKFISATESGQYSKIQQDVYKTDDITIEDITLRYRDLNTKKTKDDHLWLCSRYNGPRNQICVGFFQNREGRLMPKQLSAFCFFPTKEYTGLNFIIHAPFLLTDSREGIQAGVAHNNNLIEELAKLATQSIRSLRYRTNKKGNTSTRIIDSNIFDIIPYDKSHFSGLENRERISFYPIYRKFIELLHNCEIIPTEKGYTSSENAYWANTPQTSGAFGETQLRQLMDDSKAKWISIGSGHTNCLNSNYTLYRYLTSDIDIHTIDEDDLIEKIDSNFINMQTDVWLRSFYKYIAANDDRVDSVKFLPIFRDANGEPSAAYVEDHGTVQSILFLPAENIIGFNTIDPELAKYKETQKIAKALEITQPTMKDMIYNIILPQYEQDTIIGNNIHFSVFYTYYLNCSISERQDFIKLLSDKRFIYCHKYEKEDEGILVTPSSAYLPFDGMDIIFQYERDNYIVDMDYYNDLNLSRSEHLKDFFTELGVRTGPVIIKNKFTAYQSYNGHTMSTYYAYKYAAPNTLWNNATSSYVWIVPTIPGIDQLLNHVAEKQDERGSVFIWNTLVRIAEESKFTTEPYSYNTFESNLVGSYHYYYRTHKTQTFQTKFLYNLQHLKWIKKSDREYSAPNLLTLSELSPIYNTHRNGVAAVEVLLDFKSDEDASEDLLSNRQKVKISIADYGEKELNLTEEEMKEAMRRFASEKEQRNHPILTEQGAETKEERRKLTNYEEEETDLEPDQATENQESNNKRIRTPATTFKRLMDDFKRAAEPVECQEGSESSPEDLLGSIPEILDSFEEDEEEYDEDEYTKPTTNYDQIYKRKEKKNFEALQQIANAERLQEIASMTPKYTFKWFKTLLGLEIISSAQNETNRRTFIINFGKVSKEEGSSRTLLLEHPDRYIPQSMEDLADISMTLNGPGFEKTVAIEVVSIRSYTLRAKIKNIDQVSGVNLADVRQANIRVQNPVFLLEELQREFYELPLDDKDNLMEKLCRNIRFIFGPPGTGKTTHLAEKVIIPLMRKKNDRILVLTPTNKAADVITNRIMEKCDVSEWKQWLVRFGATGDDNIERSGAYKERNYNILSATQCVVITTIARFPYDYFMPDNGKRAYLNELKWDYIIMDEASMIPLINIIYPLYKKQPKEFIIAGDPFQIEPITSDAHWKDENIYTMVHLRKFETKPDLRPYPYPVELLLTQYRSIPTVGEVFSKFTYRGMLKHHRTEDSRKPLNLDPYLKINTLNILKFPVSKYESIYRPKRLNKTSSYQIYSALFTYEYVHYLTEKLAECNPGKPFSIGIIAPYRTEADLVDKLCRNLKPAKGITVQVGTIHGFQGDECDIILAVFNTPPSISSSPDMFLNKQNIINVAISRAKDYLFVIMPDARTEKIENLQLVNKLERLMRADESKIELVHTTELETVMFGQKDYLEQNSFTTSHQSVNVYGLPERKYEIRSEDTAVDIQVHQDAIEYRNEIVTVAEIPDLSDALKEPEIIEDDDEAIVYKEKLIKSMAKNRTPEVEKEEVREAPETSVSEKANGPTPPPLQPKETEGPAEVEFYAIPQKMNKCPYDESALESTRVIAWKHTVKREKTLMMLACPKCHRSYMQESVMQSLGMNQYRVKQLQHDPEIQKKVDAKRPPVKPKQTKAKKEKSSTTTYDLVMQNGKPVNRNKPGGTPYYDHRYGWIKI